MNITEAQAIEDQYADQAAKILQEEIDWELIADMMVAVGWTRVELDSLQTYGELAANMNQWLHKEVTKHWRRRGKTFIFEDCNEAVLFKLTWS